MRLAATIVEWDKLGEVVVNAFVAGVGVTTVFGIAIVGATRAFDAQRAGRGVAATAFAAVGIVGFAVVAAAIAFGIVVMVQK